MKLWKYFVVNRNKEKQLLCIWFPLEELLLKVVCLLGWTCAECNPIPSAYDPLLRSQGRNQTSAGQFLQKDLLDRPKVSKPRKFID